MTCLATSNSRCSNRCCSFRSAGLCENINTFKTHYNYNYRKNNLVIYVCKTGQMDKKRLYRLALAADYVPKKSP